LDDAWTHRTKKIEWGTQVKLSQGSDSPGIPRHAGGLWPPVSFAANIMIGWPDT
jgi:hypothetical protein